MRPVRLELEGFTSFRQNTVVEFEGLDLFAITGATGSGKTSLIDSILYALFGRTPRISRSAADLISQGAVELKVLFQFAAGDKRYQALRIAKRKGAGKQRLDVQDEDGSWRNIADKSGAMDARVRELLGLDFDGFTKTVVLPQGEFDRFLRGEASKRREILIELLGLEVYARMMSAANESAKRQNEHAGILEDEWRSLVEGLSPERIVELEALLEKLQAEVEQKQTDLDRVTALIPMQARLRSLRTLFAEESRLKAQQAPLEEVLEQCEREAGEAEQALAKAESALEAARQQASEMEAAEGSPDLLRSQAQGIRKAIAKRAEIAQQKELLGKSVEQFQQLRAASETAKLAVSAAEAAHLDAIQSNAADQLRGHLHSGDECPVCEQIVLIVPPLKGGSTIEAAKRELERAKQAANDADASARKLETKVGTLQVAIKQAERDLGEIQGTPEEFERKAGEVEAARREARAWESKVAEAAKAAQRARDQQRNAASTVEVLRAKLAALQTQLAVEEPLDAIESALGEYAAGNVDLEAERKRLDAELRTLQKASANAEISLVEAKRRLADWQTKSAEIRELRRQAEVSRRLGQLLQQNQFQEFVLGQTVRRLAAEGTRQLRHLSSNRYSFATDGSEFLVVDHWNADEKRSVNTLSGGESFLASLSLALALSKSLPDFSVNRDAIRLDSLFLDEGFSTLDTETMQIVLDAIEMLQADGRMIGVVSHIPELAERLPARIEVSKAPGSSTITVLR